MKKLLPEMQKLLPTEVKEGGKIPHTWPGYRAIPTGAAGSDIRKRAFYSSQNFSLLSHLEPCCDLNFMISI